MAHSKAAARFSILDAGQMHFKELGRIIHPPLSLTLSRKGSGNNDTAVLPVP